MKRLITQGNRSLVSALLASAVLLAACAAPAPTATPTTAPVAAPTPAKAAPTPTKAPTATPTKRPVVKAEMAAPNVFELTRAPVQVAIQKGFFREEGLDIDLVATGSGAKALAAALGRSVLIAGVAAADVVTATSQGQPVKAFARVNTGVIYLMVLDKDIADQRGITDKMTIEEKGRAIKGLILAGTSPGSGTDYAMRYVLTKAGLDPDRDVEITYVGSAAAMLPAFEQRAVNTMITSDPATVLVPVIKGTAIVLFDFIGGEVPGTKEVLGALAVAHRDELESQPELFDAFVRGLWRGMKFVAEQEAEARELIKKAYFPEMDAALYQKAWDLNRPAWSKEPSITEAQLKATLDYRNATAPPPPIDVKFADFATNKFVEAAKKQLGF